MTPWLVTGDRTSQMTWYFHTTIVEQGGVCIFLYFLFFSAIVGPLKLRRHPSDRGNSYSSSMGAVNP